MESTLAIIKLKELTEHPSQVVQHVAWYAKWITLPKPDMQWIIELKTILIKIFTIVKLFYLSFDSKHLLKKVKIFKIVKKFYLSFNFVLFEKIFFCN